VGPSNLKPQLFPSQHLRLLDKFPSHVTTDAHRSWASLVRAPHGALQSTLLVPDVEAVTGCGCTQPPDALGFCCPSWQARSIALLRDWELTYPFRPCQALKLLQPSIITTFLLNEEDFLDRHFTNRATQHTARAPGGPTFPLRSTKLKIT